MIVDSKERNTESNHRTVDYFTILVILILLVLGVAKFFGYLKGIDEIVYFSEKYNETLTLYYNDTATAVGPNYSLSGNWQTNENELIITWVPSGKVYVFHMSGNRLIDKDYDTWVSTSSLSLTNTSWS